MIIDLTGVTHHPVFEELTHVLTNKTQNNDVNFFRMEVAYFIAKIASNMRATIVTKDRGEIPVNLYALILATSGYGKGYSINIMENELIKPFKDRFIKETMPIIADQHLWDIANERALRNQSDQQEEYDKINGEYKRAGAYPFTFDSGTSPAVKQLRHKLLLANCGSINLQIDEIGSNLIGNTDVLTTFLELYDQGIVKQKLTKNTAENLRNEELDGKTPTNMLLFGTPVKLLDGGQTEEQFYSFMETGYARRCLFAYGQQKNKAYHSLTPAQIFQNLVNPNNNNIINKWAAQFNKLADPLMFNWQMTVPDDVALFMLEYKINCEKYADTLPDHDEIKKAELSHRYFKALKLAGALAFIDEELTIDLDHFKQAVLLTEESGEAFQTILNREKPYVKLAKYIASIDSEVTHADLHETLPFYKASNASRNELMSLAMAWGYKHHIIIKKTFDNGIEFFTGETLKETNLNELIVSYSEHWAYNYVSEVAPFDKLHLLMQSQGEQEPLSWCNHAISKGHRAEENIIPGFNMVVLDIDGGANIDIIHNLLKDYIFMTYTTKSHTETNHRFRLILPINYKLEMDSSEYKEFINNICNWLPFKPTSIDSTSNQRSKKWLANPNGKVFYNTTGSLLDALPFIPKTSKNEQYKQSYQKIESFDNLERWFAQKMIEGNRNNNMIRYALTLVDSGLDLNDVAKAVHSFNVKLSTPLSAEEINTTVLVTAAKRFKSL